MNINSIAPSVHRNVQENPESQQAPSGFAASESSPSNRVNSENYESLRQPRQTDHISTISAVVDFIGRRFSSPNAQDVNDFINIGRADPELSSLPIMNALLKAADRISTPEHLDLLLDLPEDRRGNITSIGFTREVRSPSETHVTLQAQRVFPRESLMRIGKAFPNLESIKFAPGFSINCVDDPMDDDSETIRANFNALEQIPNLRELDLGTGAIHVSDAHKVLNLQSLKTLKVKKPMYSSGLDFILKYNRKPMKRPQDASRLIREAFRSGFNPGLAHQLAQQEFGDPENLPPIALETLDLSGSNLSDLVPQQNAFGLGDQDKYDDVITTLTDMKNLQTLNLQHTRVPDQFVNDLQQRMPTLSIIR